MATPEQNPSYLDEQGKLHYIYHKDFMPSDCLPTFNSHAIEAYLHKIPGLSDIFLYFNDDLFLGRNLNIKDIVDNNCLKYYSSSKFSPKGQSNVSESGHASAWKNVNQYLNKKYKIEQRYRLHHTFEPLSKSLINKIWKDLKPELEKTGKSKFRSINDYAMTCALHPYIACYEGLGIMNTMKDQIVYAEIVNDPESNDFRYETIKDNKPIVFCLNDISSDMSPETKERMIEFLDDYFPEPSSFEK
jgi:hypothetical protein